jgi:electron transport complex protein RnfB
MTPLARRIDALLPQTQCTQCGYEGCAPYAEAIATGGAPINQCPPGGDAGIERLAALLGREPLPLNPANGIHRPPQVAVIAEDACIGCTKCIQACPVDAIVGASKRMHTVIASWCTGCELCIPPCPVDCIRLDPVAQLPQAALSRERHAARVSRQGRESRERDARLAAYE